MFSVYLPAKSPTVNIYDCFRKFSKSNIEIMYLKYASVEVGMQICSYIAYDLMLSFEKYCVSNEAPVLVIRELTCLRPLQMFTFSRKCVFSVSLL